MKRYLIVLCLAASLHAAEGEKANALADFSGALERLAETVAPAVVQVQASAWCGSESASNENAALVTSCRVVGSGVIVDPAGYIITNEHVVRNARHIRVMLTPRSNHSPDGIVPAAGRQVLDPMLADSNREPLGQRQVLEASLVGANREADIAVLKIEASGLPVIPIQHAVTGPRQGQVVLAIGSPEGLDNTMTIGIVSAVGRQPYPDYPMLYIQTDAAINPGNSGGPLLNPKGELIGINTFMLNANGHNQGLGFAVPAGVVRYVYEELRAHGFVRYMLVGVHVQTITPTLAQGLGLSRGYGVMISDVLPGSPADSGGLRPRDIITAVDDAPVSTLPYYTALLYLHDPAVPLAVKVLRGRETLQFQVAAVAADGELYRDSSVDPNESLVRGLGIFGRAVDTALARTSGLRSTTGIYVVATTRVNEDSGTALAPGDVIASVNGMPIHSVQNFREKIRELTGGTPAVLEIERHGEFVYIERDLDESLPK